VLINANCIIYACCKRKIEKIPKSSAYVGTQRSVKLLLWNDCLNIKISYLFIIIVDHEKQTNNISGACAKNDQNR